MLMTRSRPILVATLVTALASTAELHAQDSDVYDVTEAQALFDQAAAAMAAGDYGSACPKLAKALRLVPNAGGAMMKLAECYDVSRHLASAWAMYTLAEATAVKAGRADRQAKAHERIEALMPQLAHLTITAPGCVSALPNVVVQHDGTLTGAAQWGVSIPVDGGTHTIVASAPDKQTWRGDVEVRDGMTVSVTIPCLQDPPNDIPPPEPPLRRTAGLVTLGLGGLGIVVGAVSGGLAVAKHGDLAESCPGGHCPHDEEARLGPDVSGYETLGTVSTLSFVAGGALAATGLFLIFTTPAQEGKEREVSVVVSPSYLGAAGRF